jgi:hypothetical protein
MAFSLTRKLDGDIQRPLWQSVRCKSAHCLCFAHFMQQATCQFFRPSGPALASILHGTKKPERNA